MLKRMLAIACLLASSTVAFACPGDKAKETGDKNQSTKPTSSLIDTRG